MALKSKAQKKAVVERLSRACDAYRKALRECRNLGVVPLTEDFEIAGSQHPSQAAAVARLCDVRNEHRLAISVYREEIGRVPGKYQTSRSWEGVLLAPDESPTVLWGIGVLLILIMMTLGAIQLIA